MPTSQYEAKVLEMLGDPHELDRELREFERDAHFLSQHYADLVRDYPEQWIAIFRERVAAHARTLPALIKKRNRLGIPPGRALVRFMSTHPRKMILSRSVAASRGIANDNAYRPTP